MKAQMVNTKLLAAIILCFLSFSTMDAQTGLIDAIKSVKKSVVKIICSDIDSKGTGFIVDKDGYIFTCNHVVCKYILEKNELKQTLYSSKIIVHFEDGTELPAELISAQDIKLDARPLLYDYAILKISGNNFTPVKLGNYSSVQEGSEVYFCGYPLSSSHLTTHRGIVSAKYTRKGSFNNTEQKIFQVDGSINKGNSGGPLFDLATRKVVGIISTREGGISKDLSDLKEYILNQKKQSRGGVLIQGVDPLPVIVELTNTLDTFISVGIGHAVSIEYSLLLLKELKK